MKQVKRDSGHDLSWKQPFPGQVRVYVWEWPVRFSHWVMIFTIISLSITGYYMHAPYIVARGREAYVMGTMRFVHLVSAALFSLAIAIRSARPVGLSGSREASSSTARLNANSASPLMSPR